jgi:hypothetical protein
MRIAASGGHSMSCIAVTTASSTSDTTIRKPTPTTRPIDSSRTRRKAPTGLAPGLGGTFHSRFTSSLSSEKTAEAPTSSVPTESSVLSMLLSASQALWISPCTASAPSSPISPRNCPTS